MPLDKRYLFKAAPAPTVLLGFLWPQVILVMLILARCYSGHKVIIVKNIDDGISD